MKYKCLKQIFVQSIIIDIKAVGDEGYIQEKQIQEQHRSSLKTQQTCLTTTWLPLLPDNKKDLGLNLRPNPSCEEMMRSCFSI